MFPGGSTFNTLTVLDNQLAFDPRTCVANITGRSHLEVTGGTGTYEGVTGSGEVSFRAISIGERAPEPYPYSFYGNPNYTADNRLDCVYFLWSFHTGALPPGPGGS